MCDWARNAWQSSGFDVNQLRLVQGQDLVTSLFEGRSYAEIEYLLVFVWMIWNHRNEVIFQDRNSLATEVGHPVTAYLSPYQQALVRVSQHQMRSNKKWEPPDEGVMKINCDGSFKQGERVSFGAVARDFEGVVWGAVAGSAPSCTTVEDIEAVAILEGLKLARELKCVKVRVKSDCSTVVKEITLGGYSFALFGDLVQEIRELTGSFVSCSFQHTSRSCNAMADRLAGLATSDRILNMWVHDIPLYLADVLFQLLIY